MLDLTFVREHLSQVEEMLRTRGIDPAEALKDFAQVDAQRRQAISAAETLKAHRNQVSEEIARLKKSGQDATAKLEEAKQFREQIQGLEKAAEEYDGRIRIGKVNIDEQQQLAAQYGVRAIPTLLLFHNGEVADQIVGLRSKRDLKASFDRVAA